MNLELALEIDADNPVKDDLKITDNQLVLIDGQAATRQHLINRLRFFLGEWFLDQRLGFPYFRDVLIKSPDLGLLRTLFRRTIDDTPGITRTVELNLTIVETRQLSLSFRATLDGSTDPLVFTDFILEI